MLKSTDELDIDVPILNKSKMRQIPRQSQAHLKLYFNFFNFYKMYLCYESQ